MKGIRSNCRTGRQSQSWYMTRSMSGKMSKMLNLIENTLCLNPSDGIP